MLFNFVNTGEETDLDIGFPVLSDYPDMEENYFELLNFKAYEYPSKKAYDVEQKKCNKTSIKEGSEYSSFFAWKMHFKKGEKVSTCVEYNTISPYRINYVLKPVRTGKTK